MQNLQSLIDNARANITRLGDITADALARNDLATVQACSHGVVKLNEQIDTWRDELNELQPQSTAVLQQDDDGNLWAVAA